MSQDSNYAQRLRPVGQMLEKLGMESFALKIEGDDFLVQGRQRKDAPRAGAPEKPLRVVWQLLRGKHPTKSPNSPHVVEVRYTPQEIAQIESAEKAKRAGSGTAPEPHALSQILRTVGAFVDHKQGQLQGVRKDEQNVTVEYRSPLNEDLSQEFTTASLYDYWVKMYLRRKRHDE